MLILFPTGVLLSRLILSFFPFVRSILSFLNGIHSICPSCLCFPNLPPFFFKDSYILIKYPFIHVKSLHSFLSMFLSGDSQEDANGASSSSFFVLFYPMNSIQALPIISFPRCKYLLMPVHLIFSHFSLFNCSGVLKISRRFVFSTLHSFKIFRECYLIQTIQFNRCILLFK